MRTIDHSKPGLQKPEPPHETFAPRRLDHDGYRRHRRGIDGFCAAKRLRARTGGSLRVAAQPMAASVAGCIDFTGTGTATRMVAASGRPMQRIACPERDDWRITADETGFDFPTLDDERSW